MPKDGIPVHRRALEVDIQPLVLEFQVPACGLVFDHNDKAEIRFVTGRFRGEGAFLIG